MRTTVTIDEALLADAKRRAAERGVTLSEIVQDALRESLARSAEAAGDVEPLPVFHGRGGLRPGVDLTSNASVLDAMEDLS